MEFCSLIIKCHMRSVRCKSVMLVKRSNGRAPQALQFPRTVAVAFQGQNI